MREREERPSEEGPEMGDAKEESEAKVLDRVYEHIPSCISGSSTVEGCEL